MVFSTRSHKFRPYVKRSLRGGNAPDEETLLRAAEQTYKSDQEALPGGYEPVPGGTSTIKAWKSSSSPDLLIGIRGTKGLDARDWSANATIPFGGLTSSDRYKADEAAVRSLMAAHPGARLHLASHSLGSAVARELEDVVPVASSKGFNPAFQPTAFIRPGIQKREYKGADILGTIGRYIPGATHTAVQPKTWRQRLASFLPDPWRPITEHKLRAFRGGMKGGVLPHYYSSVHHKRYRDAFVAPSKQLRPSPPYKASHFLEGYVNLGNDGNEWIISRTKAGVKRWTRVPHEQSKESKQRYQSWRKLHGGAKGRPALALTRLQRSIARLMSENRVLKARRDELMLEEERTRPPGVPAPSLEKENTGGRLQQTILQRVDKLQTLQNALQAQHDDLIDFIAFLERVIASRANRTVMRPGALNPRMYGRDGVGRRLASEDGL